jgi:hypothetical protein
MLDADGATVMIISGGRGLYQRAGCRSVGKRYNFHINRSDLDKFPPANNPLPTFGRVMDSEIVSYQESEHLKPFAEIQQREPIRFLRPVDDFRAMLDVIVMRRELGHNVDALVVKKNGDHFAYLVMDINKKRNSEELVCRIGEYAGSRLAIMSAIKMLFEKYDFNELNVGALPQDTELLYILDGSFGAKLSVNTLAGTMRVINFARLMKHFTPYLQQILGRETTEALQFNTDNGKHIFHLDDEQFIIESEADLVRLILGTPDNAELKIMPTEGKLAEILREVLPLPFVWPGLNFV